MFRWVAVAVIAAVLSAVQLIPQAWNAVRARERSAISLSSFGLISTTTFLQGAYGRHLQDVAIAASNGVAFLCAVTVTVMKIIAGKAQVTEGFPGNTRLSLERKVMGCGACDICPRPN